jgi:hypothetical protein
LIVELKKIRTRSPGRSSVNIHDTNHDSNDRPCSLKRRIRQWHEMNAALIRGCDFEIAAERVGLLLRPLAVMV